MIRLIGAVIGGYLVMIVLVLFGDWMLEGAANFVLANLLLAFPYGFLGGWLAARVAPGQEVNAGLCLGVFAIVMGIVAYGLNSGNQPVWYWTSLTASLTAGSVYGSFRKYLSVQRHAPRKKTKKAVAK